MHPLTKIIEEATNDTVSLASILRKCLVVAHQLQNENLEKWVLSELNGYPGKNGLPDYRVFQIHAVGFFIGPLGSMLHDQPLPASRLEERHRDWGRKTYMMQPIATYEVLVKSNPTGKLEAPWPAEIVAYYQTRFLKDKDFVLNRAHQELSMHNLAGMIDSVRTKLLQFALALQKETGGTDPTPQNPPRAVVDSAFTTIILGGTTILGSTVHGDVNSAIQQTIIKGDFKSLSAALTEIGVPAPLHEELREVIEADQKTGEPDSTGQKVKNWIAKAAKATGKGALKVGGKAVDEIIKHAVDAYVKGQLPLP